MMLYREVMREAAESLRASGRKIRETGEVMSGSRMEVFTLANSKITSLLARVYILGGMERCMTENGKRARRKDMECGEASTGTAILENGRTANKRDMESTSGKMGTSSRVNSRT